MSWFIFNGNVLLLLAWFNKDLSDFCCFQTCKRRIPRHVSSLLILRVIKSTQQEATVSLDQAYATSFVYVVGYLMTTYQIHMLRSWILPRVREVRAVILLMSDFYHRIEKKMKNPKKIWNICQWAYSTSTNKLQLLWFENNSMEHNHYLETDSGATAQKIPRHIFKAERNQLNPANILTS